MGGRQLRTIVHSSDGEHWSAQTSNTPLALNSIYGTSDGKLLWAVEDIGMIVYSSDGNTGAIRPSTT